MSRSVTLALGIVFALGCVPSGPRAEIFMNFQIPKPADSREASAQLLETVSMALQAVSMAERGNPAEASTTFNKAREVLKLTRERFVVIAKTVSPKEIDYAKVRGKVGRAQVDDILKRYGIAPPKTHEELAHVAIREVDRFIEQTAATTLAEPDGARASLLALSAAMRRLLDVGVATSALSHTF